MSENEKLAEQLREALTAAATALAAAEARIKMLEAQALHHETGERITAYEAAKTAEGASIVYEEDRRVEVIERDVPVIWRRAAGGAIEYALDIDTREVIGARIFLPARSAEPVASEIGEEDIARAMEQRRRELIEQPLARIWPDLARVALALVQPALERARVALEPFDDVLGEDEPHLPDSEPVTVKYGPCTDYSLTLGDFRRARAAIRKG